MIPSSSNADSILTLAAEPATRTGARSPSKRWSSLLLLSGAWFFFFVLTAIYSVGAILLFPFLPFFIFGPVCLLVDAYHYAKNDA